MKKIALCFIVFITISTTMSAQIDQEVRVTPEQTEIEWTKIEQRVRREISRNRHFDKDKQYDLYPIFEVYNVSPRSLDPNSLVFRRIDPKYLAFTYFPIHFPYRMKKYAKCIVLICTDGELVGIGDATVIQQAVYKNPQYVALLKKYASGEIEMAYYIGTDEFLEFDKIYCLKNNKLFILRS